jgi:hypothetical protein
MAGMANKVRKDESTKPPETAMPKRLEYGRAGTEADGYGQHAENGGQCGNEYWLEPETCSCLQGTEVIGMILPALEIEIHHDYGVVYHDATQEYGAKQRIEVQGRFEEVQGYDHPGKAQGVWLPGSSRVSRGS